MACNTFKRKTNKSCIKDRKKILLRQQAINGSGTSAFNIQTEYTDLMYLSAFISTQIGVTSYDGVNVGDIITTQFIIPYTPSLEQYLHDTSSLSILYNNKIYNIDNIENIDLRYKNIRFDCSERGNKDTQTNFL